MGEHSGDPRPGAPRVGWVAAAVSRLESLVTMLLAAVSDSGSAEIAQKVRTQLASPLRRHYERVLIARHRDRSPTS